MISYNAAKEAYTLASEAAAKGLKLSAQNGSVVAILANKLYGGLSVLEEKQDLTPEYIASLAQNVQGGTSNETFIQVLDKTATSVAKAVQSHLSYARNVVMPVISDLVVALELVQKELMQEASRDLKIVVQSIPAPLKAASLREHLQSYRDARVYDRKSLRGSAREAGDLRETVREAIPGLEEELTAWVNTLDDAFISSVWSERFMASGNWTGYERTLDYDLLVYILAGRVVDNPSEGSEVSLSQWNTTANEIHVEAGRNLCAALARYDAAVQLGDMIVDYSDDSITVNEPLYKRWIDEGGDNASIMGATVQARVPTSIHVIAENRVKYATDWARHLSMRASTVATRRFMMLRDRLSLLVHTEVRDHYKQIYAAWNPDENTYIKLEPYVRFQALLKEKVQTLKSVDFDDLWKLSRDVLCDTVFYFTDAKSILEYREHAFALNRDLSSDDADLLARIEYVVDYVFDQVNVVDAYSTR